MSADRPRHDRLPPTTAPGSPRHAGGPADGEHVDATAEDDRFVWPPRAPDAGSSPPAAEPPIESSCASPSGFSALSGGASDLGGEAASPGLRGLLESIELDLLGRTALSLDRWAERTGWVPEPTGGSCWRCAGSVGPHEQDGEGCARCRTRPLPWDRAVRLGRYEGPLRDEVLALKFRAWRPGGAALGRYLGVRLREQLERFEIPVQSVRLVPIPVPPLRRIARGIDHTLELARHVSRVCGCPIATVLRARHRREQVGLSATARMRNIRGGFVVRAGRLRRRVTMCGEPARVWVLLDDVCTTGATLGEASRALRDGLTRLGLERGSWSIWVCVVAVAGERERRGMA